MVRTSVQEGKKETSSRRGGESWKKGGSEEPTWALGKGLGPRKLKSTRLYHQARGATTTRTRLCNGGKGGAWEIALSRKHLDRRRNGPESRGGRIYFSNKSIAVRQRKNRGAGIGF